ncbi:hypothetical protein ACN47E_005886 [Coniothyrium glycines]
MRFVSRLHLCAAASILMVLYLTWMLHSTSFETSVSGFWKASKHRIVVFGDDWSDTGTYRTSSPSQSAAASRDVDRGEIWVETLCQKLGCDRIDNFARSRLANIENSDFGPVVDMNVHELAKHGESIGNTTTFFDFKTQVRQFLSYNKSPANIAQRLSRVDERITFTVFFGLWDILEYAKLEIQPAMSAIEYSIAQLFSCLDTLAEKTATPVRVVIPSMIDVTFLPWFQSFKLDTQEHFAELQHQVVFLRAYWNTLLREAASEWKNGVVFMPDPNMIIVEQVRISQLFARKISDASGVGQQAPLFEEVNEPCLVLQQDVRMTDMQAAVVEKCADPTQYLFWDDVRLGGSAHHLIGEQAARLIRGNRTANERAMQGSTKHQNSKEQEGGSFNLSLLD